MRRTMILFVAVATAVVSPAADRFPAARGDIEITPLLHSSVQIAYAGTLIQVDPWSAGDLSRAKPADLVLVTDDVGHHLDPKAIAQLRKPRAPVVVAARRTNAFDGSIRQDAASAGVVESELVFETAAVPSVHASTIVETSGGLVAAWFGGTREGANDVGIWLSRRVGRTWGAPIEIATGSQPDGVRHPCWNPVLFEMPDRALALFYKVGPSPREWWGMVRTSRDGGSTWSDARRLPDGILGPIKNKPVTLAGGVVLAPSSTESAGSDNAWRVHFERTADLGATWTTTQPARSGDGTRIDAIQPAILMHPAGRLQAVGRTRSGRLFETWSEDGGRTWSALALMALPNPSSGIDALTLRDGRHLLVYNHTARGRSPLNVAVSRDGRAWEAALVLEREAGEYSYPAVIQASSGLVHVTYTWKRQRIKHVVIDPAQLKSVPMADARWP